MECWATVAMDAEEAVKALVLAKGLRRFMTSRPLIIVASPALPDDVWELLQSEFDVVIRLERRWLEAAGVNPRTAAKVMVWSLSKWQRIVLLSSDTMVVRSCDEIFKEKNVHSSDNSVMVVQPSVDIWRKLVEGMGSMKKGKKDEQRLNEAKLFFEVFGQEQLGVLDNKFCTKVDLRDGLMAKNLNELAIVQFNTVHPMEILCKNEVDSVLGAMESAIMKLWKDNLDHGVVQQLAKLGTNHFNGLKNYLDQYRSATNPIMVDSTLEDAHLHEVKDSVAIIGMSCRFPGANTLAEFWKLLIDGGDAICHAPEGRWTTEKCPVLPEDSKNSRAGFLSCSVEDFDGKFFGVSPKELEYMDPQQRLTLQVAWEALEDAGINPVSLQKSYTGVFGGAWRTDYREALQNTGAGEGEFFRSYLGNSFGVLTARISHTLGLTGPSVSTESGCSSSIVAVDLACKSLLRGDTNLSLACGVNLLIHPFTGKTMNTVLAPDGHCKTFDAMADGFGRAEGCGVLVLKRYADAVRDGDRVYGLIRGSAVVQEGASRSLGTPTKYCEALAMSMALKEARVEAKDVSYVETHGTGTPVGDPLEVAAVAAVYSEGREDTLTIGSVKTNIGHTESCSGIAGIIKVVLSMQNEMIPPHKNFTSLNPAINLDSIPARIPLEPMEWKRDPTGKRHRIAGVSSFGITGTDAHAIIQETPILDYPSLLLSGNETRRPLQVLALSGKSEEALEDNLKQFKEFFETTDEKLEDISHTANIGRGQFLHRAAVVGKDNAEILDKLKNGDILRKVASEEVPKICFLFTGQGSQYPGMARQLYDHSLVFKAHFDQCDRLLNEEFGIDIKDALWGKNGQNLCRTIYSQTSIFCVEYCLLQLWGSWGVKPDYVLGHSLGEFAAAVGAGILSFGDALKLVAERSRLIDALPRGKMLVLKECKDRVDVLLKNAFEGTDRWLDYAAVNSPEQTVVAGSEDNILAFAEFCRNNQIKTHVLEATHAFHSRLMDPILDEYRTVAESVVYSRAQNGTVYVSGMEGRVVDEEGVHVNADYWVQHTRDSVRFSSAAKDIMSKGCNVFLEAGPQPVLCALTMINSDGVEGLEGPVLCVPSIRKQEGDWSCLLSTVGKLFVAGVSINWEQFDQFESFQKTTIPFYPFQNKSYWFDIPDRGLGQIHPLVGTPVSNASAMKLFQNQLDLDDAEFLKDHVIGNKIIFPGAGLMEMCLVAGHSATQCTDSTYFLPSTPITLSDFMIESPLGLSELETTHLQTIVSSEDSGDTKVTVYSRLVLDKETQKWIRHASATFSPYAVFNPSSKEDQDPIILSQLLEQFKNSTEIAETYGKLAEFGLKFGPTFQTLKKLLRKTKDDSDEASLIGESLFEVKVTQASGKFVCHPVVMDALFQAVMISANQSVNTLHVPVSVQKFISFASIPEDAETAYIYCKLDSTGDIRATLMNEDGTVVGQMEGATMMETTVGTIMSALEAQKLSLPTMYEEIWRTQVGPMEKRAVLPQVFNYKEIFGGELFDSLVEKHNRISEEEVKFNTKSYHLYALYMIKGLQDLGLTTPVVGLEIFIKEFVTRYKIIPGLEGFVRYMFFELEKEGYFQAYNKNIKETLSFKLVKEFPKPQHVKKQIESLYNEVHAMSPNEVEYVSSTAAKIAAMLTGKDSALSALFPEDPSAVSAESYYMTAKVSVRAHALVNDCFTLFFKNTTRLLEEKKETIRILEVGAGTGSFTKTFLNQLQGSPTNWEFTYTDLSPIFFAMGQKVFEKSKFKIHYKILNIVDDIASQGFFPAHYDIVIANNVIHATKNIPATVRNLRNLLREDGALIITESLSPIRGTNLTFGLLDAYWHYEQEDFQLRGYNSEISQKKWEYVLSSAGYDQVVCYPAYEDKVGLIFARNMSKEQVYMVPQVLVPTKLEKAWLVFSEDGPLSTYILTNLASLGNQVIVIRKSSIFEKVSDSEFTIRSDEECDMSQLIQMTIKDSGVGLEGVVFLWGLLPSLVEGDVNSVVQPFLHLCKSIIFFDSPKLFVVTKSVLDVGDQDMAPPNSSPLFGMAKCFQNEQPTAITRVIDLDDSVQISKAQMKEVFSELLVDDQEMYVAYRGGQRIIPRFVSWKPQNTALSFPKTEKFRLLLPSSNSISDLRFGPVTTKTVLGDGEVEALVKSYALNFRDVFAVLKPSVEFENMNTLGIDWSGVITSVGPNVGKVKVGDAVYATNLNGDALPSHVKVHEDMVMHMADSITFNEAATMPAVAATAYVCLVQMANLTKDDTILIHTASGGVGLVAIQIAQHVGARIVATAGSKRKRAYLRNLGIQHVFHSRNTTYESETRSALGGRGVDVVLNSLTSPGFKEASLALCNQGGHFIEMSKLNTWTVDQVAALRPDVNYKIVDISASSEDELKMHVSNIEDYMKNEVIKPIPYVRFDASEIREALTFLQKAKHVGKIVVVMPEHEQDGVTPLFNERSTYLITGGLGGIGIELAKWMLNSGAKNVALVGRNCPNDKAADEIRRMNQKGGNVVALQCDVGDEIQCRELIDRLNNEEHGLPPLRGIMHAAGVLSDSVYQNQTWEKFRTTYNPKIRGGWNLHTMTKHLPLEHFVMFSSAVACFGSMGQSNHASANFFLDSLARYRNFLGLPATTVNWGQWGQVGVAANIEIIGLRSFSALQGISALEKVMKSQRLQTCVCDADFGIIKQIFSGTRRYLEELKVNQTECFKDIAINNEQFWNDYDSANNEETRLEVIKRFVRSMIRQILKLGKDEAMNDDEKFQDLGMDSLMMIEMKNVVQSTLGKRATITVNSVKDCHTVNQLAIRLCQLLSGEDDGDVPTPTREELQKMTREDSMLPETIKPAPLPACLPSEIKVILITGVTGNMGPYFLKELCQRPHISKIYCLVRVDTKSDSNPGQRLQNKLTANGMSDDVDMKKVTVIRGNLNQTRIGFSEADYKSLAQEVDAVVHLAVKSNFIDEYKRFEKQESTDIRTVNVKGTLTVLEFVTAMKTKLLFHASSIVANAKLDKDFSMAEVWPTEDEFDEMPNTAYPISKFVCDRLMAAGVQERGLPIKVFRFPAVGGDSRNGANVDYENNQLMLRMMSYLHLGFMPAVPIPFFIMPVDICVNLALRIFFDDSTPSDIYNVYNPYPRNETELVLIGEDMGYRIEILEPDDFQEQIETFKDSKLIHFLKEASGNKDAQNRFLKDSPAILSAYTRNPTHGFVSKKLSQLIPEYPKAIENTLQVVKRDLEYAKSSGIFTKFGI